MTLAHEDRRQWTHLAMTGFVVALRWLSPLQAIALAATALVFNLLVLPRLPGAREWMRRSDERGVGGVRMYPVAVVAALLLFDLPVAAAAWAVMGVGDAAANLAGRRWGRPPFLGRADRSLVGTLAFVASATPAAWAAHAWVAAGQEGCVVIAWSTALAAAMAGAVAELIPYPRVVDDNLPVTLAAGGGHLLAATWIV